MVGVLYCLCRGCQRRRQQHHVDEDDVGVEMIPMQEKGLASNSKMAMQHSNSALSRGRHECVIIIIALWITSPWHCTVGNIDHFGLFKKTQKNWRKNKFS